MAMNSRARAAATIAVLTIGLSGIGAVASSAVFAAPGDDPVPTDPTDPVPTDPTDPVPTDPTDPPAPTDPTDPTDPVPTDPTDPTAPTDPVPTDPAPLPPVQTDPTDGAINNGQTNGGPAAVNNGSSETVSAGNGGAATQKAGSDVEAAGPVLASTGTNTGPELATAIGLLAAGGILVFAGRPQRGSNSPRHRVE